MSNSSETNNQGQSQPAPKNQIARRRFLKYGIAGVVAVAAVGSGAYYYLNYGSSSSNPGGPAQNDTVVIAWNDQVQSLHPYLLNLNASEESPLDAIYDRYTQQDRNFVYQPGVITNWGWNSDQTKINLTNRSDVTFHDGTHLTADDIAFSLTTASQDPFAYAGVWSAISSIDVNSSTSLTLNMKSYDAGFTTWFGFFDAFIIPKVYYQKVGQSGFAANPIGSGPYKFVSNSGGVLKLQAYDNYWQGAPKIKNVVFKQVLDAQSRASEIQSGTSDFTLQTDVSTFQQLSTQSGRQGAKPFTADVVDFFVAPYFEPFKDMGVRLACHYALDKASIVNNVLQGFGRPLSMPECPGYASYDSNFNFPYDPQKAMSLLAAAGYDSSNPLNLTVGTTNGTISKDYDVAQACTQMWQNVGIKVNLVTVTQAQFFTQRSNSGDLNALTIDVWSNATGDPEDDVGYELWPNSPFSAWAGMKAAGKTDYTGLLDQALQMINPVFGETDQTKRYQLGTAASEWVVNNGLLIPLYQQAEPLLYKSKLQYTPWPQSWIRPYYMSWSS